MVTDTILSTINGIVGLSLLAAFTGCSVEKREREFRGRFLELTADIPSNVVWDVISHFKSNSDKDICKVPSVANGKMEPASKSERFVFERSGDTLKFPLYWDHVSPCEWEFRDVLLQGRGKSDPKYNFPNITVGSSEDFQTDETLPDTLELTCKAAASSAAIKCQWKSPRKHLAFRMPPGNRINLHIKVSFRPQSGPADI